jgi:hypothetical protein
MWQVSYVVLVMCVISLFVMTIHMSAQVRGKDSANSWPLGDLTRGATVAALCPLNGTFEFGILCLLSLAEESFSVAVRVMSIAERRKLPYRIVIVGSAPPVWLVDLPSCEHISFVGAPVVATLKIAHLPVVAGVFGGRVVEAISTWRDTPEFEKRFGFLLEPAWAEREDSIEENVYD